MKKLGFYLLLLIVSFYCLGPYIWQVLTSLKPETQLTRLPPVLPEKPTLEHYRYIFQQPVFWRVILNSAGIASLTTLFSLLIGSLGAFGLAKLRVKYKTLILGVVLATMMFPPVATVSPLYLLIRALQLRDTWWSLVITYTAFSLPLSLWVLTNFFQEIPDDLFLAAWVDGCTPLQSLFRIILPLAAPGFFSASILVFLFSWNEFLYALTFTSTPSSRTVPVAIALFPGVHELPWGDMAAASVVVTLPLIFFVFACQKRIVEGLTAGATKG
jgi:trehalose/maltose transport system permease protein